MRSSARLAAALLLALTGWTGWAAGQEANATNDEFAKLHQQLNLAADSLLRKEPAYPQTARASASANPSPGGQEEQQAEIRLRQFGELYWNDGDGSLRRALTRVQSIRGTLATVLREESLPGELAAVVLVESGGQPEALSPRGARGLWQLMPQTAQRYGLRVEEGRDERLHFEHSTRAAARYLRFLHHLFNDWRLALAAYNAGEGTVQRAIARGASRDFFTLATKGLLPEETRRYVPAVLAAAELLGDATELGPAPTRGTTRESGIVYATLSGD